MADTLLLTADTATAAIATESMVLVQSCKVKYTELQPKSRLYVRVKSVLPGLETFSLTAAIPAPMMRTTFITLPVLAVR